MILPRRTVHSLLFALILANILFRYPIAVPHELGTDTTFIHTLTTSIVSEGRALWIVHPTSYFGLYALSYPSAIPFYFGAGTLLGGVTIEGFMLLFGWLCCVIGVIGAFQAARKLRRDDRFALLTATLFSFAPFFIKDTFWIGSTRGFVVALIPVFLLLAIGGLRSRQVRQVGLALVLFVVLATIHRMGFMVFFIIIAYVFAVPFHRVTQKIRFALTRFERPARYALVLTTASSFLLVFYAQFLYPGAGGANVIDQYGTGALFQGTSFPILLGNMGVSLTGKIGLLFPVALLGFVSLAWQRPKEAPDKFVLTTVLLFLPLLSLRDYMGEFLIPLFTLLVVVGLMSLPRLLPNRKKLVAVALGALVVGSIVFSWGMKDYWREKYITDAPIGIEAYDASIYVQRSTTGTIVAGDGLIGGQLAAVSGKPVLPIGGASQHWTGPQQIIWGYVEPGSLSVRLLDLTSITFNSDEIYVPANVRNAEVDWETILFYRDPTQADRQIARYDVHYVIVFAGRPTTFNSYGIDRPSIYLASILPTTSYIVYENGAYNLWFRG